MKPTAILVLLVMSAVSAVALWAQAPKTLPAPPDVAAAPANAAKTSTGLASRVLKPGTGKAHPGKADLVTVHYTGWTTDGKMFDSSVVRGAPASFPLDRVIAGWTEGVQLMVAGETRRFWIPEALAYQGQRDPRGMLVFDVELISFVESPHAGAARREGRALRREDAHRAVWRTRWSRRARARGSPRLAARSRCTTPAGRPTASCSTAR